MSEEDEFLASMRKDMIEEGYVVKTIEMLVKDEEHVYIDEQGEMVTLIPIHSRLRPGEFAAIDQHAVLSDLIDNHGARAADIMANSSSSEAFWSRVSDAGVEIEEGDDEDDFVDDDEDETEFGLSDADDDVADLDEDFNDDQETKH